MTDEFMREALRLARSGTGATYPNPCVGAVVVRRGTIVGRGRSAATGGPHAEVQALRQAGEAARGATLHVTLEPCNHHGRTPPCVDAILAAGVARVEVALVDPAAHVAGKGVRRLRRHGVEVVLGVLADQAREVHAHYLHHVATRLPFVTLKLACSLDGRIATASGDSKWITGEPARRDAHRLRARHHGIAVGAATVLADDPRLDVRLVRGVDPLPIVFDPRLRVASAGRAFHLLRPGVIFLHGAAASRRARAALARSGAEAIEIADAAEDGAGGLAIPAALERLGQRDLRSLMVEGGGRLSAAFVRAGAWQELWVYRAPMLLGGDARPAFGDLGLAAVADAPRLELLRRRTLGADELSVYRKS
ncbi:bifunctional diaminohydroxyphosphoribosylaminopyrimidine deaminase/5-amino-6-(5-phosphoribosylamino)uracil reductase RibD [Nannocystaceae bacterium ST9]